MPRITALHAALLCAQTFTLAGCAGLASTPTLPEALQPAPGQRLLMTVAASGVQIYTCRGGSNAGPAAWAFVAPEAQLFDARGSAIGSHGAGPFWSVGDGSRVVGSVVARADAPSADAIPWLLLQTRSTGTPGALSQVSSIQRVATAGGVAPGSGCTAASVGAQVRVPYRADYRLFVPS